jgi:hypothetical protein
MHHIASPRIGGRGAGSLHSYIGCWGPKHESWALSSKPETEYNGHWAENPFSENGPRGRRTERILPMLNPFNRWREFRRQLRPEHVQPASGHHTRPGRTLILVLVFLGAGSIVALFAAPFQQHALGEPQRISPPPLVAHKAPQLPPDENPQASPLTPKQKQDLLKSNFEKLKKDATDLAALAKSLQQEIEESNEHVLSLKVVDKAEKIEKLARKIKTAAKGE